MLLDDLPRDLPSFLERFGTDEQCRDYLFRARWPEGFRCAACGHDRCHALQARLALECAACGKQHSLWPAPSSSRPRPAWPLVPRDLPRDLEQGRHLGHGAPAADGLRQLSDGLELAAQDPQGDGPARPAAAGATGSRPTRPISAAPSPARRAAAPPARPGRRRGREPAAARPAGRRLGRLRLAAVPDASAKSLDGFLRPERRQAGRRRHRRLVRLCRPRRPRATPTSRSTSAAPGATPRCACPAIHLVFGLAKRWLLGTHHGAVSDKHLQAYLDEYVFRFNRRTAKQHQPPLRPPDRAGRRSPRRSPTAPSSHELQPDGRGELEHFRP